MRATDLFPQQLINELLRLYKLDPHWLTYEHVSSDLDDPTKGLYRVQVKPGIDTFINKVCTSGSEWHAQKGTSWWLAQGPKTFRPTREQQQALANVEVRLTVGEYSQPYPALLVEVDEPPFDSVLCFQEGPERMLVFCLHSLQTSHLENIVIVVGSAGPHVSVENSLVRFDKDCADHHEVAARALRIAANSCLALSHYGCHYDYLFPKEVQNDQGLANRSGETGERARQRLRLATRLVSFDQDVRLHRTERVKREPGEPTGREMPPHWRSGHWRMQPHGPQNSLRKRILIPPVLVRSDLFAGEPSDTSVVYH